MKNNKIFLLVFFFLLCLPFSIYADYDAIINNSSVRIRTGATTDSEIISTVTKGTNIIVTDKTLIKGNGCDEGWYKIIYKEKNAYVCSKYVTFVNNSFNGINVSDWTARVSGNNVAVRKGPGKSYDVIERLTLGANVTILDSSNGWYKISYYNGSIGWMSDEYVVEKKNITATDEDYANTLKESGFPDSYIPYLTYLHKKYPNWIFKAGKNNLNFSTSVSSEVGVCYMQTTNDNYRLSSVPAEGSSWFKANAGVVAFYLDPRNWLTEERIFMFEKLDYDSSLESLYPELVKSIFGNGSLSDEKYTVPMFNAGKKNGISPVHIASRIRLEVGANGSDSTNGTEFTWKGQKYSGYYNFFNIGAYEVTIDGVSYSSITRGLAYAAKLIDRNGELWNNIETSIVEGSSFLANNYITSGQGTLFYQKFNVAPGASNPYSHQYQTNIQAPAVEGNQTYNSYKSANVLNQTFIFEIPVFNSMPEYTSLPKSGDTNNNLKSLSADNYKLTPAFDEDILEYEVEVPMELQKINISATAASSKAKVSGNGEYELKDNETNITITVTSEVQEEKKYLVTVKKVDIKLTPNDIVTNSKLNKVDNFITKIQNGTKAETIKNTLLNAGATKVEIFNQNGALVKDSDVLATNYRVEVSTPTETNKWTLSIKGDTSGDGDITILDLLQVQKHIKGAKKLTGASLLSGDTSGDGDITILDLLQVQKHIKGAKKL